MHSQLKYAIILIAAVVSLSLFADTYTWNTGVGNFEEPSNWILESTGSAASVAPGAGDNVVIPNGDSAFTVTATSRFSIGSLTVGGGSGTGAPTLNFNTGLVTNHVAGNVVVNSGATLTHSTHTKTITVVTYRLNLVVGGNMTVASGGKVYTDGKGFCKNKGPGNGGTANKSASHGGLGDYHGQQQMYSKCYGSIREPIMPGSGQYLNNDTSSYSGGVVYLDVAGTLSVDGAITADSTYNYASAGSVFLKCGNLTGAGNISAKCCLASGKAYGGGGRVAVYQRTGRDWTGFTGTITATAAVTSNSNGGAGTVYLECAADQPGRGELRLVTPSGSASCGQDTPLAANVTDAELPFGRVVIGARTKLRVCEGKTLTITKGFENNGTFTAAGGTVNLAPGSGEKLVVKSNLAVDNLVSDSPGGRIEFAPAKTITVQDGGTITLKGAAGNPLTLASSTSGSAWNLKLGTGVTADISDVAVSDSDASSGAAVSAISSTDSGNNLNWLFAGGVVVGEAIRWTGANGTDWSDSLNWNLSRTPVDTDVVIIPSGLANYPVSTVDLSLNTLTNEATLTLSGANLSVSNNLVCSGEIIASSGSETVFLIGDGEQTADMGAGSYGRVVIDKTAGSVAFLGGFNADLLKCVAGAPIELFFEAGKTVEIGDLILYGLFPNGDGYDNVVALKSTANGSRWNLSASGAYVVCGVAVRDCNATGAIVVGELGTDNGNNVNWDFGSGKASVWTGLAGAIFSTGGNWHPAVPVSTTRAMIVPFSGTAYVTNTTPFSVQSLVVGGLGGVVNMVFNCGQATNAVSDSAYLHSGATLTHVQVESAKQEVCLLVGGDMHIDSGAVITASAKGYSQNGGPGGVPRQSTTTYYGASYGGKSVDYASSMCYGSIVEPNHPGSAGNLGSGAQRSGGVVHLVVSNDLKVAGSIVSDSNFSHHTGGSVNITAGRICGTGPISANGGNPGCGGRVALKQTKTTGWSGYTGSVTVSGASGGTYYRRDASGNAELFIGGTAGSTSASGMVQFPMADDGDAKKAYADAALSVSANTKLMLTNTTWAAGSTVRVRDIDLVSSSSKVDCLGSVIKVAEKTHKNGRNWGDAYEALVVENGGKIVWVNGLVVAVR